MTCPHCPHCNPNIVIEKLDAGGVLGRVETSRAAAMPSRRNERGRILWLVGDWWDDQKTMFIADEIAKEFGKSPNQIATRLQELRRVGMVEYVVVNGRHCTAPTSSGHRARLQRLTKFGKQWLQDNPQLAFAA